MSTLLDAANWVCTDVLNRQDVLTMAGNAAVNFYRVLTRKVPFDELMFTSNELLLTQNQSSYSIDTLADVNAQVMSPALKAIMSIRLTQGPEGSPRLRLRRSSTRLYDAISASQPGFTATYARIGKNIELNPAPNGGNWTIRFRYWAIAPLDNTPVNTVIVMDDDWLELIKWETLYRVYYTLGMRQEAMELVMPTQVPSMPGGARKKRVTEVGIIPRLWNDLLTTISAKENTDEDFSINPAVRNYSIS